jgi:uncharacterized protein (DUF924 family)
MTENFEDILSIWFAPGMDDRRYADDPHFDARIRDRFMTTYRAARDGRLDPWRENARSLLALIIVLDQLPRNMFRGDAQAFATDHLALALTKEGIKKGFDREFSGAQLDFFYMPLMHSEALDDHRLLAELGYGDNTYACEHREAIERFGRYPTRNAALGRQNTPEEACFLKLTEASD